MPRVVVIAILALAATGVAVSVRADFQFVHGGHTYLTVTTPRTWPNAAADASARQYAGATGALARIESQGENDAIITALLANVSAAEFPNTDAPDGGGEAYVWLAATDRVTEGAWLWDGDGNGLGDQFWQGTKTGSVVGGLYSNWGRTTVQNEPDNFLTGRGGGPGQDAGGISLNGWPLGPAAQWNDVNDTNLLYYLVEFNVVPEPTTIVILAVGIGSITFVTRLR